MAGYLSKSLFLRANVLVGSVLLSSLAIADSAKPTIEINLSEIEKLKSSGVEKSHKETPKEEKVVVEEQHTQEVKTESAKEEVEGFSEFRQPDPNGNPIPIYKPEPYANQFDKYAKKYSLEIFEGDKSRQEQMLEAQAANHDVFKPVMVTGGYEEEPKPELREGSEKMLQGESVGNSVKKTLVSLFNKISSVASSTKTTQNKQEQEAVKEKKFDRNDISVARINNVKPENDSNQKQESTNTGSEEIQHNDKSEQSVEQEEAHVPSIFNSSEEEFVVLNDKKSADKPSKNFAQVKKKEAEKVVVKPVEEKNTSTAKEEIVPPVPEPVSVKEEAVSSNVKEPEPVVIKSLKEEEVSVSGDADKIVEEKTSESVELTSTEGLESVEPEVNEDNIPAPLPKLRPGEKLADLNNKKPEVPEVVSVAVMKEPKLVEKSPMISETKPAGEVKQKLDVKAVEKNSAEDAVVKSDDAGKQKVEEKQSDQLEQDMSNNKPAEAVSTGEAIQKNQEQKSVQPAQSAQPAKDLSGILLTINFSGENTSITASDKKNIADLVGSIKDGGKRLKVVSYAKGISDQVNSARRISLQRAIAIRSEMIKAGFESIRINVHAAGEEGVDLGYPDSANIYIID